MHQVLKLHVQVSPTTTSLMKKSTADTGKLRKELARRNYWMCSCNGEEGKDQRFRYIIKDCLEVGHETRAFSFVLYPICYSSANWQACDQIFPDGASMPTNFFRGRNIVSNTKFFWKHLDMLFDVAMMRRRIHCRAYFRRSFQVLIIMRRFVSVWRCKTKALLCRVVVAFVSPTFNL